jgi:5-methyltetrahydrofolate--homocysteine methyltransferase
MSNDAKLAARIAALHEAAAERILILDGSWGAKIQELKLTEEDFRGERFADHPTSLRGDTDLLCLTAPEVVTGLAGEYLEAGADIITTNTFTATSIAQADYDMQAHVVEINVAGARLSREAGRAGSPARSARPTARCRSPPPSTIRAPGRSTSTRSMTPIASRRSRSTRAERTSSWSRPSLTR